MLFNFDGIAGLSEITGRTRQDIHQSLISSSASRRFESGEIEPDAFAASLAEELRLDISPPELLTLWTNWESGHKPGTYEVLDDLSRQFNLACLSNTSVVHWDRLLNLRRIGDYFHRLYASHLINHWKPDPRIFAHVTDDLGPAVSLIVYFDDNAHIVEAAREFGWDAHQAMSPESVVGKLVELGLSDER
ncbi:MAG: HAD-IA family hydrolase [Proteobacteria bacterium]|nr:HAD-IA family hydrolase [Pseudomonadota bacterium]